MESSTAGTAGTIRSATLADGDALARLCTVLGLDAMPLGPADVSVYLDRGHLLVLDLGAGAVGAFAFVALEPAGRDGVHARVELFAIHPALAGSGAEDRMAAALLAMCEASGCVDVDVGSTKRRGDRAMGGR
jgi:hypothetical protein